MTIKRAHLSLPAALAALAFIWKELFSGSAILDLRVNELIPSDAAHLYYPLFAHYAERLADGDFPLWCPLVFGGFPLAASQIGIFHPLHALAATALAPLAAYNASLLAAMLGAGAAMWGYARALGAGPAGAAFGAIVYASSGFFVGHLAQQNVIKAAACLPLLLWGVELLRGKAWRRGVALGGAGLGLQFLAATPQIAFYSLLAAILAAAAGAAPAAGPVADRRRAGALPALSARLALMATLGVALGAVQVLPMAELYAWSDYGRAAIPATGLSYRWADFLGFFLLSRSHPDPRDLFLGAWPAALAVLGLAAALRSRERRPSAAVLLALLAAGLILSSSAAAAMLPGMARFRFAVRAILLAHAALCALAGLGVDAFISAAGRHLPNARWAVWALPFAMAVAGARSHLAERVILRPAADLACAEDARREVADRLKDGLLFSYDPAYVGLDAFAAPSLLGLPLQLWPNSNILCGLPALSGREALEPRSFGELQDALWAHRRPKPEDGTLEADAEWVRQLEARGVRSVLSHWDIRGPGVRRLWSKDYPRFGRRVRLFELAHPAPPARLTAAGSVLSGQEEPDGWSGELELAEAGSLVVRATFTPGWKATVDGAPASVRAEGPHIAVSLGPGRHRLSLRYRPGSVALGACLSALALLGLGLWVRARRPL